MVKTLSTLEVGLVAAGVGLLLRALVDEALVAGWAAPALPWLFEQDGLVSLLLGGVVGSVGLVSLLARRRAAPLRAPLGALLVGCAVALALQVGIGVDLEWPEGGQTGVASSVAQLTAGLVASLALALRPALRPRAPRRAAGLALGLTLLAGGRVLRELALDAWPEGYPEFVVELVPTRSLQLHGSRLREGEEPLISQGERLVPAGPADEPTYALDRGRTVRLGPAEVLRLSWVDAPPGLSWRIADGPARRLAALTATIRGERLLLFVDGSCVMEPEVHATIGRSFRVYEGRDRRSDELRAFYERVTGETPPP